MKKIHWISLCLLLVAGACSNSKVTSSWKAKDVTDQQYKKILVLGLVRDTDRSIQMNMEIHLVGDLQELGYHAISSLQQYGPKAFDKMDEETAIAKLKNTGVDAVITMVLLDKKRERNYVPAIMQDSPLGYFYNRFWPYRTALYNRVYEPGYYITNTEYFWESHLYDMSNQQLVYSVQTQSFDPASSEIMGHQNGQTIVKDLVKQHLLNKTSNLVNSGY